MEISNLTAEESALLRRIQRFHPDFHYTNRVKRYVELTTGERRVIYVEVQFDVVDGLIEAEFVSYHVGFPGSLESVQFSYDAGTAFRGFGSIQVSEDAITSVETSCGTAGCETNVLVNGKLAFQNR